MSADDSVLYAGFSQVTYEGEPFDLGHGLVLRPVYAHLFAAPMMAYARAPEGSHHPAPWRSARGGFSYDIEVELAVRRNNELPGDLTADQAASLVASLLRLAGYAYLMMPVTSDTAFEPTAIHGREPILNPVETEPRIIFAGSPDISNIRNEDLTWVKGGWPRVAALLGKDRRVGDALAALDACTVRGRTSSALLLAWGALEELFAASGRSEIRYRISAYIASYLEPVGSKRLGLFKEVQRLYDARSVVAHSSREADVADLLCTFLILQRAMRRIVTQGTVPSDEQLKAALLSGEEL